MSLHTCLIGHLRSKIKNNKTKNYFYFLLHSSALKTYCKGFSLLELMIALVIIGILLKVALPDFSHYMRQSQRVAAQQDLLAFEGALEQFYLQRQSYFGAASNGDIGVSRVYANHSPSAEPYENRQYDLLIDAIDREGESFVLLARAIEGNTNGDLYYYSDGRRGWDRNNDGQLAENEQCWQCR